MLKHIIKKWTPVFPIVGSTAGSSSWCPIPRAEMHSPSAQAAVKTEIYLYFWVQEPSLSQNYHLPRPICMPQSQPSPGTAKTVPGTGELRPCTAGNFEGLLLLLTGQSPCYPWHTFNIMPAYIQPQSWYGKRKGGRNEERKGMSEGKEGESRKGLVLDWFNICIHEQKSPTQQTCWAVWSPFPLLKQEAEGKVSVGTKQTGSLKLQLSKSSTERNNI